MAADIEFNIVGNFNTDSLKEMLGYIEKARGQMEVLQMDLATSMQDMDAPAKLLSGQLDRCLITADRITEKASTAIKNLDHGTMSEDDMVSASRVIQNMYEDLMTSKGLLTGSGSFSVEMARNMMQGLPAAVRKEFNAAAPKIVSALRTAMKTSGAGSIDVWDIPGMTSSAMKSQIVQQAFGRTSATAQQKSDFIRSLLVNATPIQRTSEYQTARHGKVAIPSSPEYVEDILPALYKGSYAGQGYIPNYQQRKKPRFFGDNVTSRLMKLFENNNVAVQAAERSGLLKRNSVGELELEGKSDSDLLRFGKELWTQFRKRTGGLTQKEKDYFDDKNETDNPGAVQRRIIQRASSGNGGKTTAAMSLLSDLMLDEKNFTDVSSGNGSRHVLSHSQEPKRLKELYAVKKLNPFKGNVESTVPINESQITDLLGLKGHDYENSDAVRIISLNGYDPKNKEHVQAARDWREKGIDSDGHHYSFHTMHGTGNDLTYRMIRTDLRDKIAQRYEPMAESLGLGGKNVFEAFMPTGEFENITALAKYYDQLNKMWTDSYSIGSNISGKKFAIVDMSTQEDGIKKEFANGIGWVGNGIIPHALQARGALSLKGSVEQLGADTVGEWGEKTGKKDSSGRVMMRGLNGEMFDASQYNGIFDISQIKNLAAYTDLAKEKGNDAANEAFTRVMQEFPLRAVADYSFDADANSLGPQMMTFLALSPEMQRYQAKALVRRMQELQTLEGQRRYVFDNPESDPVSKAANDLIHGDEFLETSPEAAERVNLYMSKLLRRASAGEFINYGDVADIQNERLLRSADISWAMASGGLKDAEIAKYREAFEAVHGRKFSDDEIKKYLTLQGGVADFGHLDADKVSATRSPTGFGQFITRQNYAGILAPVMKYLYGQTPTGFYGNEEDYKILSGADMDADTVKSIADKRNAEGLSLVSEFEKHEEEYKALMLPLEKLEVGFKALKGSEGKIDWSDPGVREKAMDILTEAAATAPLDMGFFSNAQSRLAGNLDLFANGMELSALTAARGNSGYDKGTTKQKKPGEIEKDAAMYAALALGQEYTKIPAHLIDAFNVKKITPDSKDEGYSPDQFYFEGKNGEVIDPSQVFETSSGRFVDKRFFEKLDKTNLPSFQSATAVGAMYVPKAAREAGFVDDSVYNDLAEVFGITERATEGLYGEALSYGNYGAATQRVMKNHRDLIAQFAGNKRFSVSDEELEIIASQYAEAMQEITGEATELYSKGEIKDRDKYVSDRAKEAGLNQVAMALGTYAMRDSSGRRRAINTGMTYANIAAKYGKQTADELRNMPDATLADTTRGNFGSGFEQYAAYAVHGDPRLHYVESGRARELNNKKQSAAAKRERIEKEIEQAEQNIANNKKEEAQVSEELSEATKEEAQNEKKRKTKRRKTEKSETNEAEADIKKPKAEITTSDKLPEISKDEAKQMRKSKKQVRDQKDFARSTTETGENGSTNVANLRKQLEEAKAEEQDIENMIAAEAEYASMTSEANELVKKFDIGRRGKANTINGRSLAQGYFNRSYYAEYMPMQERLFAFMSDHPEITDQQRQEIGMLDQQMRQYMFEDFGNKGTLYAKEYADSIQDTINNIVSPSSSQKKTLDAFENTGKEATGFIEQIDKILNNPNLDVDENSKKHLLKTKDDIAEYVAKAKSSSAELRSLYTKENEDNALIRSEELKAKYNRGYKKSGDYRAFLMNRDLDKEQDLLDRQKNEGLIGEESYAKASESLSKMRKDAKGWKIEMSDAFQDIGKASLNVTRNIARQFGRQLYQSAISETKKFVQEFDKSMTTIQMITLKSDDEMKNLGSGLIDKAKELKVSVGDVTSTATSLYRQGLSDTEMNSRLDTILKFSTVSGTKVEDATKLITTAMNTGLVTNAQEAADIVTSLGDNAATNAAQIEKGIEKAGAAAAVDGTTFTQLAAMLTAITATTQLTGNVAGTTMNSIFGRMNKIGTNELIEDENGNKISGSAIATLLRQQGIETHINGEKRSSFDILKELSGKWQGLSDAEQQQLSTAIAGTRQYSNFSAIMLGMAEGNVDQYLGLADKSNGIVDQKYEVYTRSLEAALNDLKTTWDSLVAGIQENDIATGLINGLSTLLGGFRDIQSQTGGVVSSLILIAGAISAVAVAASTATLPGFVSKILGIAAGAAVIGGATMLANQFANGSPQDVAKSDQEIAVERNENFKANAASQKKYYQDLIDETNSLAKKISDGTATNLETSTFESNISELASTFNGVSSAVNGASSALDGWTSAAGKAQEAADDLARKNENVIKINEAAIRQNLISDTKKEIDEARKANAFSKESLDDLRNSPTSILTAASTFVPGSFQEKLAEYGVDLSEGNIKRGSFDNPYLYTYTGDNYSNAIANILAFQNPDMPGVGVSSAFDGGTKKQNILSIAEALFDKRGSFEKYLVDKNGQSFVPELASLYADKNEFREDFKTGFKGKGLNKEYVQTINSIIASIIAGTDTELNEIVGAFSDESGTIELLDKKTDEIFENTYDFYSLGKDAQKVIKGKIKKKTAGMTAEEYLDYYTTQLPEDIMEEAGKAKGREAEYTEEERAKGNAVQAVSASDAVSAAYAALTAKNRKYDTEYQSLLRDVTAAANSENPAAALAAIDSAKHDDIIRAEDPELLKIWNDVYKNNGKGVYSVDNLVSYLEGKVYGSTSAQRRQTSLSTSYSLSNTNSLLQRLRGGELNEGIYQELASATNLDVTRVREDVGMATEVLQGLYDQNLETYLQTTRDAIDKEFGEDIKQHTDSKGKVQIDRSLQETINSRYRGTGVSIDSAGNVSFSPSSVDKNRSIFDYSRRYTNEELAGYAQQLASNGGNWNDLFAKGGAFESWSPEQINAVASYSPALAEYLKMSPDQRSSTAGQALKRQYEIQFAVEGLSTLEEAGAILENTANLVAQLQKGGTFEIKAQMEIANQAEARRQQEALLNNGSLTEQIQAIKDITGLQDYEIQERGLDASRAYAQEYLSARNAATAQYYNELSDAVGFDTQAGDMIDRAANREGFVRIPVEGGNGKEYTYVDKNTALDYFQNALYKDKGAHIDSVIDQAMSTGLFELQTDERTGLRSFVLKNTAPGVANPFLGKDKSYTDLQLAQARQEIIGGTLTSGDRFQAAAASGGRYFQQYMGMLAANKVKPGTYDEDDLDAARRKMQQEESIALKDAEEMQALEDARLNSTTVGGAYRYAQLQYEQNNKAGIAANAIYESFSDTDVKTIDDLLGVLSDKDNAKNWEDLFESSPDLAKKIKDLGLSIDENGKWDVSGLIASGNDVSAAFAALAAAVRGATTEFSHEDVLSTGETYEQAIAYTEDKITDENAQFQALSSVLGSEAAQEIGSAYQEWKAQSDTYQKWLNEYQQVEQTGEQSRIDSFLASKPEPAKPGTFDPYANMSDFSAKYVSNRLEDMRYGQRELSEFNRYEGLLGLIAASQIPSSEEGSLSSLRKGDSVGAYEDYTSGVPGANQWLQMSERLSDLGLNINDLNNITETSKDYDQFNAVAEKIYGSLESAKTADEDFRNGVAQTANKLKTAGKFSDEYSLGLQKNSKDLKTANKAQTEANKLLNNIAQRQYYRQKFRDGQTGGGVAEQIAEMTGFSKKDVGDKNNKNAILEQLEAQEQEDIKAVESYADGVLENVNNILQEKVGNQSIEVAFPNVELLDAGGNINFDAVAETIGSEAATAMSNLASQLAALGVKTHFDISEDGQGAPQIKLVVDSMGSGKKGGGGGGGGGKSAVDTLLEKHKHEVAEAQHEIKMTQIQESHYERLNEYDKYIDTLDEEIAKQTNLRDVYARHVQELQDMMKGLEQYSDDWWKAKEAIAAAEEALAEYSNTIDEINGKKITITQTKQENQDKPGSHRATMFEKRATYYMDRGQFENYAVLVEKQIAQMRADRALNDQQIAEWESLLDVYEYDSAKFNEVRDKIWALQAENAELDNQTFEKASELNQQRIAQIQTDYQNGIAPIEHEQSMLDIWGNIYQNEGRSIYYDENGNKHTAQEAYRSSLAQKSEYNTRIIAETKEAIAAIEEQMKALDEGSEAWLQARDARNQLTQAVAQATLEEQEYKIAIEESIAAEQRDKYDSRTKDLEHEMNMLQKMQERYEKNNDYVNSEDVLANIASQYEAQIELKKQELAEAEALLDSGELSGDRYQEWKEYVMQLREQVQGLTNDQEEANRNQLKTMVEHAQERFDHQDNLRQHQLKLVRYEETRYQNNGELLNYKIMLEEENKILDEMQDSLREQIGVWEELLAKAEPGSDLYYEIMKKIYGAEEALKSYENEQEKVNENMKKADETIAKIHKNLIDLIDRELKTREKERRERLSAEVSIQSQILNLIRNRYKQEWAIIKDDINKKKQALQEEKALINERLNARLNAEKEEERYREISELQRQLAIISSDPTRTKDALEIQKKLDDLLKDNANEIAQQEAASAGERIDDEMKAYDDYVSYQEARLNETLKDANSTLLSDELEAVMGDSDTPWEERFNNYMEWIKQNDDNYKFGTEAMRLQMEESNKDSWKKMVGFVDTYWAKVQEIIDGGIDSITSFMKESSSYIWGSSADQRLSEYDWEDRYDKYAKTKVEDAVFSDTHILKEAISDLQDNTYKVELTPDFLMKYGLYDSELQYMYERDKSVNDEANNYDPVNMYEDRGKKPDPEPTATSVNNGSAGKSNGDNGPKQKPTEVKSYWMDIGSSHQKVHKWSDGSITYSDVGPHVWNYQTGRCTVCNRYEAWRSVNKGGTSKLMTGGAGTSKEMFYADGGLVDYTGPAWVDGTPTRPEAFLDATDTENIRAMLDGLNYVQTMPMLSPSERFFGNSSTVGDVNIVINQAELKSDADYDEVARKVGQAFTKQLSREGFQLSGYAW